MSIPFNKLPYFCLRKCDKCERFFDDWYSLKIHRKTHKEDKLICAVCNFKCVGYGNGRKRFDAHEHSLVDGVWLKVRKKRALNNEKASKIKKRPLKIKNRAKKVSFVIKFDRMICKAID